MRVSIRLLASVAVLQLSALAGHANEVPPPSPEATTLESFAPPARAMGDLEQLPLIFKAYRDNDLTEAAVLKSKLSDPAAQALVEWFVIRSGMNMGHERIMTFRKDYPDWPLTSQLRRRMENTFLAQSRTTAQIRAFFDKQPPITPAGRIAFGFALKNDGLDQEATDLIRHAWREDTFGSETESRILARLPTLLTQADHRYRMERHLLKENWGAASRAAGYAGKDYATLVKARMAVFQGKKKAEKAFAAVPAALRSDPSYLFSRALLQRRSKNYAEAAKIIMQAPKDHEQRVDGDEWWAEQRRITRELLDKGEAQTAYDVASHHAAESPAQQIEAEFHAGWIALRFLNEPEKAGKHFATVAQTASTPISLSRVAYWQARAAEAAGAAEDAKLFYARAASHPTTYYGQLAREKLGGIFSLRSVEPLKDEERKAFETLIPVRALSLLQQAGETELSIGLYSDLAQTLNDPGQLDAIAALATAQQNPRAVLAIGKIALQRGFPLDQHAYPLAAIPDFEPVGDEVEPAMVYAIARQESAFNPKAISSAGARGLMQLMPATAKRTAQRFGVGFDLKRLIEDPSYNAKIGSAHLGELMEDWKGSYILAFASYNAGGGNVQKWVKAYGDPRKPDVDLIDWVERIPFHETRNYVQRVMENLHVYRARLKNEKPVPAPATAAVSAAAPAETADAVETTY
ncbi:lytic transglycosylase domain-containing protein [Microvirga guangxiensis]|uniref:Soluble lytic murein transglycosylase n=1 Tax=Microvirga guangxiensis TaxID=549386 RepID=A0A1G5BGY0_9HYPH|nr:lytic transglycosylase domain-containing protein [Microvirga guangxiensis]SCX89381.1 soluble lytic murein transglycosylase [Microvirga guangxiensis]